ncbi:MAG: signal peptidase II [Bacillota bacterium]
MFYTFLIALLVVIDQLCKYTAETYLKPIETYPIIQNIFHLTYARNTGAAFSILQGKQTFLITVSLIVIIALMLYFFRNIKKGNTYLNLSISLIIGGALGNLIDRIRLGYVVDFLDFILINYPIFNTADVFVVSGIIFLIYAILFTDLEI